MEQNLVGGSASFNGKLFFVCLDEAGNESQAFKCLKDLETVNDSKPLVGFIIYGKVVEMTEEGMITIEWQMGVGRKLITRVPQGLYVVVAYSN